MLTMQASPSADATAALVPRRPLPRSGGLAVGFALVAALILLAVIGATWQHGPGAAALRRGPASVVLSVLITLAGLAGVASLALLFWGLVTRNRRRPDDSGRRGRSPLLVVAILLAVFACLAGLLVLAVRQRHLGAIPALHVAPVLHGPTSAPLPFNQAASFTTSGIVAVVVVFLVLARLARSIGWRRALRRLGRFGPQPGNDKESFSAPGQEAEPIGSYLAALSVQDPTTEPDPRRAVIACYLRLLDVAARHGAQRREAETPTEYLRRVAHGYRCRRGSSHLSHGSVRARPLQPPDRGRVDEGRRYLRPLRVAAGLRRRSTQLTRGLWAGLFTIASLVAVALAIALAVGAPHPAVIERAAAAAFGLLGIGAGSIALSAAVEAGLPKEPRLGRLEDDLVDAGAARLLDMERSLRLGTIVGRRLPRPGTSDPRAARPGATCPQGRGFGRSREGRLVAWRRQLRPRGSSGSTTRGPFRPWRAARAGEAPPRRARSARGPPVTGHREDPSARLTAGDVALIAEDVVIEVERAVIGKREAIVLVLIGVLSGGHVLLEDVPGLAKTLLVRSLARVLGLETSRIQFTPDLMPADVTGSGVFDQARGELVFRPGPVFANLVLGDEINRAPPKTQAALLEAMQERAGDRRTGSATCSRPRSRSSPPRTRSSTRAPTRSPRRSSTVSCFAWPSAIPTGTPSGR